MSITFHQKKGQPGRLHVGYRRGTWLKVWYEPVEGAEPDYDGTIPIALFQLMSGGPQRREPMEGEVAWEPHFDPKLFETNSKKEKDRKQMQFLYDAWRYLNETDPEKEIELEEELDQPEDRRWSTWFNLARQDKVKKRETRAKRRQNRLDRVRDAQIDPATVDINSDTSDDEANDSGYEEELERVRSRTRARTPMGPPPPPRNGQKRKAPGGRRPAPKQPPKKRQKKARSGASQSSPMLMSGGSGSLGDDDDDHLMRGGSPSIVNGRAGIRSDYGNSQTSDDYDNTSPQPPPMSVFGGRLSNRTSLGSGIEAPRNGSNNSSPLSRPRLNGSRLPLIQQNLSERFRRDNPHTSANPDEAQDALAREHNGGLDEADAITQALRASMAPEDPPLPTPAPTNLGGPTNLEGTQTAEDGGGGDGTNGVANDSGEMNGASE